ncbi:hypothetical protein EXIGLDRAFT_764835 [Exidia glandulosa HHB12029]|uniref:Uncharacterized protein n=1 Tax=Exidia glandulosa HHB12029 TaxID=1314781 RepID=A0A165KUQ7_EXIGL|nr:hypothetical protein EXIGLDRAFT_764835 [Exidia glandulosa HHB12029]
MFISSLTHLLSSLNACGLLFVHSRVLVTDFRLCYLRELKLVLGLDAADLSICQGSDIATAAVKLKINMSIASELSYLIAVVPPSQRPSHSVLGNDWSER